MMNKQIILCGAGKIGKQLFEILEKSVENTVVCFADNHKAGQIFCGKPVISLAELQQRAIESEYDVFLSVGFALADELGRQLDALGIRYTDGDSYLRQHWLTHGEFENIVQEGIFTRSFAAFCKTVKPRTFVNVGANTGGYVSIAAHFMPTDARIYAFEPIDRYFDLLSKRFAGGDRVEVAKKAVSNQIGQLDLFATVKPGGEGIAHSFTLDKQQTMFKDEYSEDCKTLVETVDTITLDTFFENI